MKYVSTLIVLLIVSHQGFTQDDVHQFLMKENRLPPGTSYIGNGVYMDEAEILNIHWLEFIYYLKKDSSQSYYESMLPDTTLAWRAMGDKSVVIGYDLDSAAQPLFLESYLRYPSRRYFPVIGISFFQATEYCKWRSKAVDIKVNEQLAKLKKTFSLRYEYYIPPIEVYKKCLEFNDIKSRKIDSKSQKLIKSVSSDFNPRKMYHYAAVKQEIARTTQGYSVFVPGVNWIVSSYDAPPMKKSFRHIVGNVSEMTNKQGVSFGGSWIHTMDEIKEHLTFEYTKPEYWLGFRCACKVDVIKQ